MKVDDRRLPGVIHSKQRVSTTCDGMCTHPYE